MADKKDTSNHLIDDSGMYTNVKVRQTTLFIAFCRIVTVVLIILGIVAMVVGYM